MIKSLLRFFLAFLLCCLLVYAPEILSRVSSPYALTAPERTLLRIALLCDDDVSVYLNKVINAYQKQYPQVHLRVTQFQADLLFHITLPYPDIILCSPAISQQLPAAFSCGESPAFASDELVCALYADSLSRSAAAEFAAYIYDALSAHLPSSEI